MGHNKMSDLDNRTSSPAAAALTTTIVFRPQRTVEQIKKRTRAPVCTTSILPSLICNKIITQNSLKLNHFLTPVFLLASSLTASSLVISGRYQMGFVLMILSRGVIMLDRADSEHLLVGCCLCFFSGQPSWNALKSLQAITASAKTGLTLKPQWIIIIGRQSLTGRWWWARWGQLALTSWPASTQRAVNMQIRGCPHFYYRL